MTTRSTFHCGVPVHAGRLCGRVLVGPAGHDSPWWDCPVHGRVDLHHFDEAPVKHLDWRYTLAGLVLAVVALVVAVADAAAS